MRTLIVALPLAALAFAGGLLAQETGVVDVARVTELRLGTARSEDYSPLYPDDPERKEIFARLRADDPEPGFAAADAWLSKVPVDAPMHDALADALERSGRHADAFRHRSAYWAILASIASSGDGTREHPYRVIAVAEEYLLLDALGTRKRVTRQALSQIDGKPHDVLYLGGDGEEESVVFDVSLVFQAMQNAFGR